MVRDEFQEVPRQHDDGRQDRAWPQRATGTGDDIPGILLDQPACAEFICRKLFRHFVSETQTPSDALIAPLARAFRESHYQIQVPVAMILRSNLFFDPSVRRRRVKSPVEFAVGTIRALEILKPTVQAAALAEACGRMGQSLYRAAERRRAGTAARPGSTRPRCWPGPTWPSACSPMKTRRSGSGATPGRWPAGMASRPARVARRVSSSICWPPARSSPRPGEQIEKAADEQEFRRSMPRPAKSVRLILTVARVSARLIDPDAIES